jgi:dihydrofolate reductase
MGRSEIVAAVASSALSETGRRSRSEMSKLYVFNMITLDGYFEGPNRDISWHNVDEEFNEFAIAQLNATECLLFGRVTYELMASYWPTPAASTDDPVVAARMNSLPKIVCSRTLAKAEWNNTRLVKDHIGEEISKLKEKPGKDLAVFGSGDLSLTLLRLGLIDEYRIIVNPVLLGKGRSLFEGVPGKVKLKLLSMKAFRSGNVLLTYHPDGAL